MLTSMLKTHFANQEPVSWCLNQVKLKSARTNEPLAAMALAQVLENKNQKSPVISASVFPLIFTEEAYVEWSSDDAYIMALLIGGQFIAIHEGGYPGSRNAPGTPGQAFEPKTYDQVEAVIGIIKEKGAVVDLTPKGVQAGVWDPENGFCVRGFWELDKVTGWTEASTDNNGKIVTHIEASEQFRPMSLGAARFDLNPIGTTYTFDKKEFVAAKFNDGWRLISGE